jgi:hypothetical protein
MRPVIPRWQYLREECGGAGGAASDHLAEQREVSSSPSFANRRCAIAEEAGLLDEPPEWRNGPARTVRVTIGNGVSEPLLGGVRPETWNLIEEGVRLFNLHLAETLSFVAEFHAGDARLSIPAIAGPDFLHPVLARDGDLGGLVVDATGMRRTLAEVDRGQTPARELHTHLTGCNERSSAFQAGVICFVNPNITALAFVYLIAAWAILSGVAEITFAMALPQTMAHPWLTALSGALSVVFGVLVAVWPQSGAVALTWVIGIYAILNGVSLLYHAFLLQVARTGAQALGNAGERLAAGHSQG